MKERYTNDLLGISGGGVKSVCISIIVPLHKQLPQRNQNKLMVKNAINEAKDKLRAGFKEYDSKGLIEKLDQIQSMETFTNGSGGVGLFVSDGVSKMVHFPFEVKRKVIVDFSFEVRDLIFANHRRLDFFVLALSNNKTRLFKSLKTGIEEIVNEKFPLSYEEQFQYPDRQKPKVSGSYGSEESTIREERQKNFYRHLDKLLAPHFKNNSWPVMLLGVEDQQTLFKKVSQFKDKIAIDLKGNFDRFSSGEIAKKINPEVQTLLGQKDDEVVNKLEKLLAADKITAGIEKVWKETDNGGKTLILEKDYSQSGYLNQKSGRLSLNAQTGEDWLKISDLVDDVIELISNGNGKIVFVGNGKLKKFQKIAMVNSLIDD